MKANVFLLGCFIGFIGLLLTTSTALAASYADTVQADGPIAYYRFNDVPPVATNSGSLGAAANGTYNGDATAGAQAPRPPTFPGFETNNTALQLDGAGDFVRTISGLMNSRPVFTISGWMRRNTDQPNRTGLWGQNNLVEFGYINNNTLEVWTDNGLDISPNPIPNGEWAHLAIVSTGSPGTMTMYTNGAPAGSRAHTLPANNSFAFNIGGGGVFDGTGNFFNGQIDEVAIFDKALTADQIAAHYFSTVASPPIISRQPQSQTVVAGASVVFTVMAPNGPLSYQWLFNGTNIAGATNATLTLTNVQPGAAGNYQVIISNASGSVTSVVALLTVTNPVCTPPPSGLVAWWRAENTALDSVGTNLGTLVNGASFASGWVGLAFSFDGVDDFIRTPGSPLNNLLAFTLEGWILPRTLSRTRIGLFGQNDAVEFGLTNSTTIQIWTQNGGFCDAVYPQG
jgi:hypothetical protein